MKRVWSVCLWSGVAAAAITAVFAIDLYLFAKRDETRPADAAIVLGAAAFGNRPSPVLRERINHAIRLHEQGIVKMIIFTGGQGERSALSEAAVSARYALANGVPQEAILLEEASRNTYENLTNAQKLAKEHHLTSFLIVSTPFHMRRAMWMAHELGLDAFSSPTRTTRWISTYTKSRAFMREVVAYIAYAVR